MKNGGALIDALKSGEISSYPHYNPYIKEALLYPEILYTKQDLQKNKASFLSNQSKGNFILEIGCYLGKTVLELATLNPNLSVLGLDITYKRVVKTARKIHSQKLNNAYVSICDGLYLCQKLLPQNYLMGVCIFFPDPWPKSHHEKHRLLNKEFVDSVFDVIKPGGFFWLKTDQEDYFQQASYLLKEKGFRLNTEKFPEGLTENKYETEFQKMFTQKSIPFYEGIYFKN